MGAPGLNIQSLLQAIAKLRGVGGGASPGGFSLLPGVPAQGGFQNPAMGNQNGMTAPGNFAANIPQSNFSLAGPNAGSFALQDPTAANPTALKLSDYAAVMKGLASSADDGTGGEGESARAVNARGSANPQLVPIQAVSRPAPGPQSVGAALASPEGARLLATLRQMQQGMIA